MSKNTKPDCGTDCETLPIWIESALSFGGKRKLIVAQDEKAGGFLAILDFGDIEINFDLDNYRVGAAGKNPMTAIAALDHALMEDAADDMVKSGAV